MVAAIKKQDTAGTVVFREIQRLIYCYRHAIPSTEAQQCFKHVVFIALKMNYFFEAVDRVCTT